VGSDTDHRETLVTTVSLSTDSPRVERGQACLVVIYGADLGKRIPLGEAQLECGRSIQTDLPLDDEAVSRRHARFAWTGADYAVQDLGSTNGTYVNDAPVSGGRLLRDGDQIKIGRTIFKFLCSGNVELSYHEEIYRLMTRDGLTQVHNKRAFDDALDRELSRGRRYARHLSLVIFDIDHFKRINDSRGHLAGDAVLRQLAGAVSTHVRREDVLARVGGEEFALLLPELPIDNARFVAEKLRALVERTPFRYEQHTIPVTASFGVASVVPGQSAQPEELYQAADARLYAAKNGGRNRVA
jgi:diguanylate cyclase (GGDEF)-like protein